MATALVALDQLLVRVGSLRILVEILHVGMRRSAVEIVVVLLHVLAVIALAVRESEEALLQDRVFSVPQRKCEAQSLAIIRYAGQTVFAPMISAGVRLLVSEIIPGV